MMCRGSTTHTHHDLKNEQKIKISPFPFLGRYSHSLLYQLPSYAGCTLKPITALLPLFSQSRPFTPLLIKNRSITAWFNSVKSTVVTSSIGFLQTVILHFDIGWRLCLLPPSLRTLSVDYCIVTIFEFPIIIYVLPTWNSENRHLSPFLIVHCYSLWNPIVSHYSRTF